MFIAGHANQRVQRKRQLQAEYHLAEDQQFTDGIVAHEPHAQERRDQRQPAGNQTALPARNAQVEVTLHDHLPSDGAGECRALAGGQQGNPEQDAGKRTAYQRVEQVVGILDLHHISVAGVMECGRCQHQDRGVDQQRQGQGADGVDARQLDGVLFAGQVLADHAGLHNRGVQVEVMGHHRRAKDADGQVQRRGIADG